MPKFTQLWRHAFAISRLAISRDQKLVAIASEDRTVRVWDLETGKAVTPPLVHSGSIRDCEFSRDGKQLLTAGGMIGISGEIRLWDIATGKTFFQTVQALTSFYSAGFTDAGEILSASVPMKGNGNIQLQNPKTGSLIATKKFNPLSPDQVMNSIAKPWSLAGARVLEMDNQVGRVFDLSAKVRRVCEIKQDSQMFSAAFSNDGSRVLTTTWHSFYVWEAATGRELACYDGQSNGWDGYDFANARVKFSLDNQRITIAGANSQIMTFDIRSGASKNVPPLLNLREARPFISQDGRFVAIATRGGSVEVWDVWGEKPLTSLLKHSSSVIDALFADNNRLVITGCNDGSVRVWDLSSAVGMPGRQAARNIERVEYSSDDKKYYLISRTTVTQIDYATGKQLSEFTNPGPWPNETDVSVAHHLYAAGRSGGIARVWDFVTGKPVSPELKHVRKEFSHVAISPNGKLLATIDVDSFNAPDNYFGQANIWQIETGKRILGPFQFSGFSATTCVAFSPDSRLLAIGGGSVSLEGIRPELKLLDLENGGEVKQPFERSPNVFTGDVSFDPHGRYLAWVTGTPFAPGGELRIWDLKNRCAVGSVLRFADSPIQAHLRFDAHGRYLAAPVDNQVHVLLLDSGEAALPPLVHEQTVDGVEFSADGRRIITSTKDNVVRVWDIATGCRVGPNYPHPNQVRQLMITPDGRLITTCADDWIRYRFFQPSDRPIDEISGAVRLLTAEEPAASRTKSTASLDAIMADWEYVWQKRPSWPGREHFSAIDLARYSSVRYLESWRLARNCPGFRANGQVRRM